MELSLPGLLSGPVWEALLAEFPIAFLPVTLTRQD